VAEKAGLRFIGKHEDARGELFVYDSVGGEREPP
jgi:hypothetical protein